MGVIMRDVTVNVDVDPYDVLDELDSDDIVDYLKDSRKVGVSGVVVEEKIDMEDLIFSYFHGDLDIKKLIKGIGVETIEQACLDVKAG